MKVSSQMSKFLILRLKNKMSHKIQITITINSLKATNLR